jgi:hypothetical protein
MTALALSPYSSPFERLGSPAAGPAAASVAKQTLDVLTSFKTQVRAGSSLVFQELRLLAQECGPNFATPSAVRLAERFLLALPSDLRSPELAVDADGDVVFDWRGTEGQQMTVALRHDGRLSYAARISSLDKDYGTKQFLDTIPKPVLQLVQRVISS